MANYSTEVDNLEVESSWLHQKLDYLALQKKQKNEELGDDFYTAALKQDHVRIVL